MRIVSFKQKKLSFKQCYQTQTCSKSHKLCEKGENSMKYTLSVEILFLNIFGYVLRRPDFLVFLYYYYYY